MTTVDQLSIPVAVLRGASDTLVYRSVNPGSGPIESDWPYLNPVDANQWAAILCIDTWGAGGAGGFGIYSQPQPVCGGGGGSGSFNRTYIQLNMQVPLIALGYVVESELVIRRDGFSIRNEYAPELQPPGSSATLTASVGANNGGQYTPAAPYTVQAVPGSAGPGAPLTRYISPSKSNPNFTAPVNSGNQFTTFPSLIYNQVTDSNAIQADVINMFTVLVNAPLRPWAFAGAPGQSGANGGVGAPGTVAGGFVAGWGGNGVGRDKNGVDVPPSDPMTVVYVVAVYIAVLGNGAP